MKLSHHAWFQVRKKQKLVGDEFVQFYQVCPGNGSSPEKADDAALLPQMEKATVMSMHDTKECQDLLEGDHRERGFDIYIFFRWHKKCNIYRRLKL